MKNNSIAFFNSNDIYPVSADSTLPFEQHRDIFYLSGIDQEESVLMLFKASEKIYEILFLKETLSGLRALVRYMRNLKLRITN